MTEVLASGAVRKMKTELGDPVQYTMLLGDKEIPLNQYLGAVPATALQRRDQLYPLWPQNCKELQPGLLLPLLPAPCPV